MPPTISVIIVNWNGAADLRRCLAALARQDDRDLEIVIVDNGSVDGSVAVARTAWPAAIVVALPSNVGFAAGCNHGLRQARGEWILTLNNDTEVQPGFVAALRAAADDASDDVGMIQPRMLLAGRDRLNSTGVLVHRDGSAHDRDFGAPLDARPAGDEILCITAGAGLYRRAMLEGAGEGAFDASYFMYFEDVDLGWRCALAGWRATYLPNASVEHAFQASSRRRGRHFVTVQCMRNRVRTLLKNASWRLIARSLPRSASDLLWLLQHAGGTALADWLRAVRDGLRGRGAVTRLARIERHTLEQRWLVPRA